MLSTFCSFKGDYWVDLHKITREKLYGKYNHNLLVHSPLQYRLVSGKSINCEGEERFFNTIRGITNSTSNYKPGHIIGNVITRHQVESRCKEKYHFDDAVQINKDIQNLNDALEKYQYNTFITYDYIKNNVSDWQSHFKKHHHF